MVKKPLSPEDKEMFKKAMQGIKPLKNNKIRIQPAIKTVIRSPMKEIEKLETNESISATPVPGEAFISFKQDSISHKTLTQLRRGHYPVESKLDLHGMTVAEAKSAVDFFLQHCLQNRFRVVLIIHGKGMHSQKPILKNKLNVWLRSLNQVLAFCSASIIHGSRGATYVLLKAIKEMKE